MLVVVVGDGVGVGVVSMVDSVSVDSVSAD